MQKHMTSITAKQHSIISAHTSHAPTILGLLNHGDIACLNLKDIQLSSTLRPLNDNLEGKEVADESSSKHLILNVRGMTAAEFTEFEDRPNPAP